MHVCVDGTSNLHSAVCEQFAYYLPLTKICQFFGQKHKGNWVRWVFCVRLRFAEN